MDASIVAPRTIGDDILKFFVSSNICQDGSDSLFIFISAKYFVNLSGFN